jgi:hypothetical protein
LLIFLRGATISVFVRQAFSPLIVSPFEISFQKKAHQPGADGLIYENGIG